MAYRNDAVSRVKILGALAAGLIGDKAPMAGRCGLFQIKYICRLARGCVPPDWAGAETVDVLPRVCLPKLALPSAQASICSILIFGPAFSNYVELCYIEGALSPWFSMSCKIRSVAAQITYITKMPITNRKDAWLVTGSITEQAGG